MAQQGLDSLWSKGIFAVCNCAAKTFIMDSNLAYPNKCELCGNSMKELDAYYEKYSVEMLAQEQSALDEAKEKNKKNNVVIKLTSSFEAITTLFNTHVIPMYITDPKPFDNLAGTIGDMKDGDIIENYTNIYESCDRKARMSVNKRIRDSADAEAMAIELDLIISNRF